MAKPKLLLSAFACDPVEGSEPHVGWNWARMLAADFDLHVVTRRYRIEAIAADPLASIVTFHAFDLPFCSRIGHRAPVIKLYYCLWQLLLPLHVLPLQRRHRFDILQHLTYNVVDMPGLLWLFRGSAFVWGPVGGGQVAPPGLKRGYGRGWWRERLRAALKSALPFNPLVRAALARASLVLCANAETAERLRPWAPLVLPLLETAIDAGPEPPERRGRTRLRILWLGHVLPRKGLALAIDAFAAAVEDRGRPDRLELVVAGDGPALPAARRQAARSVAAGDIRFLGAVSRARAAALMEAADIFLFTSLQDTSGNVVLEAMRAGLPVVALRHQGARLMLAEGGGRLVGIGSYDETCSALGTALRELAGDEAARLALGRQARRIVVSRHGWDEKRRSVLAAYAGILAARARAKEC